MWQVPQSAFPSHLCPMTWPAALIASNSVAPSAISTFAPEGITVTTGIASSSLTSFFNHCAATLTVPLVPWRRTEKKDWNLVNRRSRPYVDRGVLLSRQMPVERHRHGAVGELLRDEQLPAAVTHLDIEPLGVHRPAVGSSIDPFRAQVLNDGVAAGAREARAEMHQGEEPVHGGRLGRDISRLDAFEGLHVLIVALLDALATFQNGIDAAQLGQAQGCRDVAHTGAIGRVHADHHRVALLLPASAQAA